jgi:hypothetical protein
MTSQIFGWWNVMTNSPSPESPKLIIDTDLVEGYPRTRPLVPDLCNERFANLGRAIPLLRRRSSRADASLGRKCGKSRGSRFGCPTDPNQT